MIRLFLVVFIAFGTFATTADAQAPKELAPARPTLKSEAVINGDIVHIGRPTLDAPGFDLLGPLVGSEGTLAIVTKATLRLLRRPQAVVTLLAGFNSIDEAGEAVSAIIGAGIVPAAVEMMRHRLFPN